MYSRVLIIQPLVILCAVLHVSTFSLQLHFNCLHFVHVFIVSCFSVPLLLASIMEAPLCFRVFMEFPYFPLSSLFYKYVK